MSPSDPSVPAGPLTLALAAATLAGCGSGRPAPEPIRPGWSETGVASWYGPGFHGRPTASGEVYDMEAMTAAHPWLPFGTRVRVENRENRRSAVVRINDRGPFKRGRVIDLSRAAAREIGLLESGTAAVRLTVVETADEPSCLEVQVGAFGERANARAAAARARSAGFSVREVPGPDGMTRVVVGPFDEPGEARRARDRLGGFVRACPTRR